MSRILKLERTDSPKGMCLKGGRQTLYLVCEELAFSLNSEPKLGVCSGTLESYPEVSEILERVGGVTFAWVTVQISFLWCLCSRTPGGFLRAPTIKTRSLLRLLLLSHSEGEL